MTCTARTVCTRRGLPASNGAGGGWMVYDNLAGELLAQRDDSAEGDSWRCVRPNKEGGHCGHVVPRRSKVDRTLNELVRGVEAAGD